MTQVCDLMLISHQSELVLLLRSIRRINDPLLTLQ